MSEPIADVIGDYRAFAAQQRDRLLARGIDITPYRLSQFILFEDLTHVKFYRPPLRASVELFEGPFADGFHHVDNWTPQRLVTATGPNPLPSSDTRVR